jgi:hypothetical protein
MCWRVLGPSNSFTLIKVKSIILREYVIICNVNFCPGCGAPILAKRVFPSYKRGGGCRAVWKFHL